MVDLKLEAGYQFLVLYFIIFIFTMKHYLTTVWGGGNLRKSKFVSE